jgi:superfamily II DNA/RNA helicase
MENTQQWPMLTELKPFLQKAWTTSGFQNPTTIQEKSMHTLLDGKDVIAESPTGTGKTLSYLLPVLQKIDEESNHVQAVILAPTRELVMQINQEIQVWTKDSKISGASFIGGANVKRQLEKLKKRPQIVVGTTGRLQELIKLKKLKMHEVKMLVVDEADQVVEPEHIRDMESIIKSTLKDRQVMFYSATITPRAEKIAKEWMNNPEVIRVKREVKSSSNVEHVYIVAEHREKVEVLRKLINMDDLKALTFLNDIEKMKDIEEKLKYKKVALNVLNATTTKREREFALKNFREGVSSLLLATDVAARGLDIEGLMYVINVDFPREPAQYTHRAGRTGRMGKAGTVISIVTKREEQDLKKLSRTLNIPFTQKMVYRGELVDMNAGK